MFTSTQNNSRSGVEPRVCPALGLLGFTNDLGVLEVVTHPQIMRMVSSRGNSTMLLAEAPQCPDAELGGEAGEAAELVRLQCEMSSPGECVPGPGAASPFCFSHCRPAWEQHWDSCITGVRDGQHGPRSLWDFPCVPTRA